MNNGNFKCVQINMIHLFKKGKSAHNAFDHVSSLMKSHNFGGKSVCLESFQHYFSASMRRADLRIGTNYLHIGTNYLHIGTNYLHIGTNYLLSPYC